MTELHVRPASFDRELVATLPRLRAYCLSLAGNTAVGEDLVQETAAKALANHHHFQPGTNMRAWLFTIAHNVFVSGVRKAGREIADATGAIIERQPAADDPDARLQASAVMDRVARLPFETRHMVREVALGADYVEVAAEMGLATGTVKSRLNRARVHLTEQTS